MKGTRFIAAVVALTMLLALGGHAQAASTGQIYLYGEAHGVAAILEKEFELWRDYYENQGMRHLFVEYAYYTAEYLNLWMQADDDEILDMIFRDAGGTAGDTPDAKAFYQKIKAECPETVFHGTDVGHQYGSTGWRYLLYLKRNGLEGSEQYALAEEAVEQGKYYYDNGADRYRENKMVENFIREFDKLDGESVMGIYGGAHTGPDKMAFDTPPLPCMGMQLKERYGDAVHSENLRWAMNDMEPLRVDTLTINGKAYEAPYFGAAEIGAWSQKYVRREFWRLENAYEDFKDAPKTGEILPYDNYPMQIETGQVFVIDYTGRDGSIDRHYYCSNGYLWNDRPSTEAFAVE